MRVAMVVVAAIGIWWLVGVLRTNASPRNARNHETHEKDILVS